MAEGMIDLQRALRRFTEKIDIDLKTGCWHGTGGINRSGYGKFRVGKRAQGLMYAHRWSYQTFMGPIPEGMTVEHKCLCRNCVHPKHLQLVTRKENTEDCNRWYQPLKQDKNESPF